jgi:hypothetical protein
MSVDLKRWQNPPHCMRKTSSWFAKLLEKSKTV